MGLAWLMADDEQRRTPPTFQEVYPGFPKPIFEPLRFETITPAETLRRAEAFYQTMQARRTTRHFSSEPVSKAVIEQLILTAGTAPSGAHRQPWQFVAVQDAGLKRRIREVVEAEEERTYTHRMPAEWRAALAPLGTDYVKAHLTEAPWLIVVFREKYGLRPDGTTFKHYYTTESASIAAGLLIAAVHQAGLSTLTHTPNPMAALRSLLRRPINEEALLIMPVGYPAPDAQVPKLQRKPLKEIMQLDLGEGEGEGPKR